MCAVVIRSNLSSLDLHSYFSSQWSDHSASQSVGWLTDMQLVGREGKAWGSVQVHRAVILPLCPLLAVMEKDVIKDDPTIILPEYPAELLQAVINLIYRGSTPTTTTVTDINILEVMGSLGLNMPLDCLLVIREESNEKEIICFKTNSNLDIIKISDNNFTPLLAQSVQLSTSSLGIQSSPLVPSGPPSTRHCGSKTPVQVQTPSRKQKLRKAENYPHTRKSRDEKQPENVHAADVNDISVLEEVPPEPALVNIVPIQIKHECEEIAEKDIQATSTRKRKWSRRSETLEIQTHHCDFCNFKFRFVKDLQEHCDLFHSDKEFVCSKCDYKTSTLVLLKAHNKKRHIGVGHLICEICGFKANSKRKITWHKTNVHEMKRFITEESRNEKDIINGGKDSLSLSDNVDKTLKDLNDAAEFMSKNNVPGISLNQAKSRLFDVDSFFNFEESDTINHNAEENIQNEPDRFVATKVDGACMFKNIEILLKEIPYEDPSHRDNDQRNKHGENDINTLENVQHKSIGEPKLEVKLTGSSSEVIGFKCSVLGCSRVFRVKLKTTTHALSRLKEHQDKQGP